MNNQNLPQPAPQLGLQELLQDFEAMKEERDAAREEAKRNAKIARYNYATMQQAQRERDNALARLGVLEKGHRRTVENASLVCDGLEQVQQENAALRLASVASAAHRKALEQLVSDCLKRMKSDADEIVSVDDHAFPIFEGDVDYLFLQDDWKNELLSLERRFAELTTQESHGDS